MVSEQKGALLSSASPAEEGEQGRHGATLWQTQGPYLLVGPQLRKGRLRAVLLPSPESAGEPDLAATFFLAPRNSQGLVESACKAGFPGPVRSLGIPSLGYSRSKACRGWLGALWGSMLITCAVATAASLQTTELRGACLPPSPGELVSACRDPCFR